ncbi:tRNA (guanosine(37)-N1)-methyltransferase TrmD [Carnobacteriaceae bacterium zg-ZUI252]|nr:tRNA (guanosine(37)-N1)-methyltransferase TrmD [Carnobacteriaceae bacterium zg-ZUI252]MBS4770160.1 tRNA (guanosine(37)-N1)-methyltransferase TrmD [Carnobacteriaceae bacterium zg-ZUI240]
MKFNVLSLFPEMFQTLEHSIIGKALDKNLLSLNVVNFRDFAFNTQKHVDDYPFGGGAGMLLKIEPLVLALRSVMDLPAQKPQQRVVLLDPAGVPFTQALAQDLANAQEITFICGHYEGYDERIKNFVTDEISLGDYVLTGGELGAMVMIDAISRLLPDVLGNHESAITDSHATGLLEHPQYTRPREFEGIGVPDVLLSGNHKLIEEWREKESLKKTYLKRPDMFEKLTLTKRQEKLFEEVKKEIEESI